MGDVIAYTYIFRGCYILGYHFLRVCFYPRVPTPLPPAPIKIEIRKHEKYFHTSSVHIRQLSGVLYNWIAIKDLTSKLFYY